MGWGLWGKGQVWEMGLTGSIVTSVQTCWDWSTLRLGIADLPGPTSHLVSWAVPTNKCIFFASRPFHMQFPLLRTLPALLHSTSHLTTSFSPFRSQHGNHDLLETSPDLLHPRLSDTPFLPTMFLHAPHLLIIAYYTILIIFWSLPSKHPKPAECPWCLIQCLATVTA